MAEISIIIPCYNVGKYVMRCFNSLQKQTIGLDKLELIFVDDASTDGTWDILTRIEQMAPESVCIVQLKENQRQGGARNIGLTYASGEYVAYLDSDDWVEPDMYEELYQAALKTGSEIAFCRHVRDDGQNSLLLSENKEGAAFSEETEDLIRLLTISDQKERSDFIASNVIGYRVWDKLFRKSFLLEHEISFPIHLTYEEVYFGCLIYLYATKVCILEKQLYHYFVNNESTVLTKNGSYHRDIFQVNYLKWEACEERGFLTSYREALEFDFIMSFYFTAMKIFCLRFDRILYEDFMELKRETLKRVPDFQHNSYCRTHIPSFYRQLLILLRTPVTQQDLDQVQNIFLTYHKML